MSWVHKICDKLDAVKGLVVVVQMNEGKGWRTIAAFDVEAVGKHYADRCRDQSRASPTRPEYRTVLL